MLIEKVGELSVMEDLVANDGATGFWDIPDEVYHQCSPLSQSKMYDFAKSPWHYRKFCERPKEQTDEMKFGTMVHMAVLEPQKFDDRYYVKKLKKDFGTTADGKKAYDAWAKSVKGKESTTELKMTKCKEMRQALFENEMFCSLCESGVFEVAAFAQVNDIWCRGKADIVNPDLSVVVDLKTAASVKTKDFEWKVEDGYNVQAAHYLDLFNRIEPGIVDAFVFVVIEKNYPYPIQIFVAGDDVLKQGYRRRNEILTSYKHCLESDTWPGYPVEIQNLSRPERFRKEG